MNIKIVSEFVQHIGARPVNLAFDKITLKTLQKNDKSVIVRAPSAQIHDLKISQINLKNPVAILKQSKNTQTKLQAVNGIYHAEKNNITLKDQVKLFVQDDYKVTTDHLEIDLNNFIVKMPQGIHANYNNNSLKANNVAFEQKENKATFTGNVKVVINPKKI